MTTQVFKNKNTGLTVAAVLFAIVALIHLFRILTGTAVIFGAVSIPISVSVISVVILAALSVWLFKLSKQ